MSTNKNRIPLRSEVAVENTWALEDLYTSEEEWKKHLAATRETLPAIAACKGKLGTAGASLLTFFKLQDELEIALDRLGRYAFCKAD